MITRPDSRIWLDIVSANRSKGIRSYLIDVALKIATAHPAHFVFVSQSSNYEYEYLIALISREYQCDKVFTVRTEDTVKPPIVKALWERT